MRTLTIALTIASALAVAGGLFMMIHHHKHTPSVTMTSVPTPVYDSWVHWKQHNGKSYGTDSEESYRLSVFYQNFKKIAETMSRTDLTFEVSLNQFADLTQAEFKATYLGTRKSQQSKNVVKIYKSFPSSVDWRGKAVTAVKNQGQCGSCWAFSATGSSEGAYAIKNGSIKSFSEQQLVDCAGGIYGNQGCSGGLMDDAFDYEEAKGLMLESDYAYTGENGTCHYDASKVVFKPSTHHDVPASDNAALMAAIAQGPVSVGIEGDSFSFQMYSGGVYNDWSGCGTDIDHGVLAVGYGSQDGKDFYLVKNSWGASWGESGYIMMARKANGVGMCGITEQASYPSA